MPDTYELEERLADDSIETVSDGAGAYRIRVSQALQAEIADHEERIDDLESAPGGGVQSIVAGANVTVDNTDPANPIVSASGGGGSVTEVDSPNSSITITNGTGPVISVDVNEAELENGGSHELSVAGLSGVLATPQRANTLVESSGPTDLPIGTWSTGQFLVRSGSTAVGIASPTAQEYWGPSSAVGAVAEEFDGNSIPAGYSWRNVSDHAAVTVVGVPSLLNAPAVTNQIRADYNTKRGWVRVQTPVDNKVYALYRTIPSTGDFTLRGRVMVGASTGTQVNSIVDIAVMSANAGFPNFSTGGARIGWVSNTSPNGQWCLITDLLNSAGAAVINAVLTPVTSGNLAPLLDLEFVITRIAASNTWGFFVVNDGQYLQVNASAVANFTPAYICFRARNATPAIGALANIYAGDYLRFETTADPVL